MFNIIRYISITTLYLAALSCIGIILSPLDALTDALDNKTCMECHSDDQLTGEINGLPVSMFIDQQSFAASVHQGFDCIACHTDIQQSPHSVKLEKVECNNCHSTKNEMAKTVHDIENGPSCIACHGDAHKLLSSSNKNSLTHQFKIGLQCAKCHQSSSPIKTGNKQSTNAFHNSVHAIALAHGNSQAPSCINCHDYHSIMPLRNPQSKTNFMNISETCGECHPSEMQQYNMSIHGKSALAGHKNAPVCTDCHGEHAIYKVSDERSPASLFKVSKYSCGRCHSSILITSKQNNSTQVVETYFDSFHGLALQNGLMNAANCSSCHGAHFILPNSDPNSSVHQDNLAATCAQCHTDISDDILTAPVHAGLSNSSYTSTSWMQFIYPLIIIIIGAILLYYLLTRKKRRRN